VNETVYQTVVFIKINQRKTKTYNNHREFIECGPNDRDQFTETRDVLLVTRLFLFKSTA